jgi:hypothetical protein
MLSDICSGPRLTADYLNSMVIKNIARVVYGFKG